MKYWNFLIQKLYAYKAQSLIVLAAMASVMGYFASHVELDYTYTKALPTNDPFYLKFMEQKKEFGADANVIFIGVEGNKEIDSSFFSDFIGFHNELSSVDGIKNVWSIHNIATMVKDTNPAYPSFRVASFIEGDSPSHAAIQKGLKDYLAVEVYKKLFYNPKHNFLLLVCAIDAEIMKSSTRTYTMGRIQSLGKVFANQHPSHSIHISGMPYIIVQMASKVRSEMIFLIIASAAITLLILLWCFRSFNILVMATAIMGIGLVFCFGIMNALGYKITLLNSLIPTLVVIIGIPNCIYLVNRYHALFAQTQNKKQSILLAAQQMGFIILLCNLIAAIGFFSFCFTQSPLLVEFGWIAGISIVCLFPITLILIINFISIFPRPSIQKDKRKTVVDTFSRWVSSICYTCIVQSKKTLIVSGVITILFCLGILRVKSNSYIVDGLPQNDPISKDLQYFENTFQGLFNIDVFVESDRPILKDIRLLNKINKFCDYVTKKEQTSNFTLSITEGLKFLRQSFYDNAPDQFSFPNTLDFSFMYPYINNTFQAKKKDEGNSLLHQFISKDGKKCKITFFVQNIGSNATEKWIADVKHVADSLLGSSKVKIDIGGSGVAFIKGNVYIMNGLMDSILLSLVLIGVCIFFLYRRLMYVIISIIPNLIPLVGTLGILGWLSINLNPATIIVFGIAFGIANDLTLRIMIAYAYEGDTRKRRWEKVFLSSSSSVIFTALVLILGFSVFCISAMRNVFYIGLLISISMILSTLCNLILLPILLKYYEEFLHYKTRKKEQKTITP